jgi:hypothetical protein
MRPAVLPPSFVERATTLMAWLIPVALAVTGWRYLLLIVGAATYPANQPWLIIWTISSAALLGSLALAPRRAGVTWMFVIAGAAVLMIILSGMFLLGLIALWVLSGFFGLDELLRESSESNA